MKNTLKCILYKVSTVEMVGLLWWNANNDVHFAEFHIMKYLNVYIELWGRMVPSHKQMQNVNNSVVMKMFWQQSSEAQVQEYTDFPGLVYHRHRHGELCTTMVSIHITSEEHSQPCIISWMAATMATHSAWHSVPRWASIYLGWYYQYKEFASLGIWKSTR
jgi:hypothetical protein